MTNGRQIIRNFVPPRIHLRGDRKMLETCYQYERIEAGCDEAGRGCLAGAVFAAAVILPPDFHDPLLNDSKQMSERNRDRLRPIIEREGGGVGRRCRPARTHRRNQHPQRLVRGDVSGGRGAAHTPRISRHRRQPLPFVARYSYRCIVKGDGKYADIAAASVLAKTHRDRVYAAVGRRVPPVRLGEEQGLSYARTPSRREALRGDAYHRLTFNHESGQLELF